MLTVRVILPADLLWRDVNRDDYESHEATDLAYMVEIKQRMYARYGIDAIVRQSQRITEMQIYCERDYALDVRRMLNTVMATLAPEYFAKAEKGLQK